MKLASKSAGQTFTSYSQRFSGICRGYPLETWIVSFGDTDIVMAQTELYLEQGQ
jgi:hypothetical protein